jgi:glycosyltransferase involved in cell wall biosynthesis
MVRSLLNVCTGAYSRWVVDVLLAQSASVSARHRRHTRRVVEPNVVVSASVQKLIEAAVPERFYARQLCVVGVLTERKRVDLAVRALKYTDDSTGLVIVGDGAQRARLGALVEQLDLANRVTFLGNVARDRVIAVMRGSDAMLHCSIREGAPWAVGEALTAGLPVVTIAGGGADELVAVAGGNGVVVAAGPDTERRLGIAATELLAGERAQVRSDRFLATRLPGFLTEVYSSPVGTGALND